MFILNATSAQQSNTLFLLHSIPQANQLNPAVQPECKWFVGLPFLNTVHLDYSNSSFTYNELTSGNSLQLDFVYGKLHRMNMISSEAVSYPISIGYTLNNNYFSFSIADRANTYSSFSKKLVGLTLYGNTQYVGEIARFNNTRANATYYREYSVGWALEWDRFTSFGFKAKLLFGKANLNTGSSRALLGTELETYDLSVQADVSLNSSFPIRLIQNSSGAITDIELRQLNYFSFFLNPRNPGMAVDFGVINKFSNEITLSASVLDLGMIVWTDKLYNVNAKVDSFLYEGALGSTDFSAAAYFRDLADSVISDIIYDVTQHPYISPLPTQVFLGASYKWKKNINLGVVFRNVLVNRRIKSSLTASMNATLFKQIETSLSWTYMNNSALNFGGGLAYSGRGLQFYAVTDNIIGLFKPYDSRSINIRFGMNLLLGCPRNYNKIREQERSMVPCRPESRMRMLKSKRKR